MLYGYPYSLSHPTPDTTGMGDGMNAQPKLYRTEFVPTRTNGGLSDREWEVMLGIAKGEKPEDMSKRLGISVKTISTYRARIIMKTGLRTNAEIAVAAYKQGLIE